MNKNFGTPLSRSEMKEVKGGRQILVCTCGNTNETTVCGYSTFTGLFNCVAAAGQYCSTHGGGANCTGGDCGGC